MAWSKSLTSVSPLTRCKHSFLKPKDFKTMTASRMWHSRTPPPPKNNMRCWRAAQEFTRALWLCACFLEVSAAIRRRSLTPICPVWPMHWIKSHVPLRFVRPVGIKSLIISTPTLPYSLLSPNAQLGYIPTSHPVSSLSHGMSSMQECIFIVQLRHLRFNLEQLLRRAHSKFQAPFLCPLNRTASASCSYILINSYFITINS